MSPEQIGGKPISATSDIFSLGVVFYEMLAGRLPFTGDSSLAVLSAIVNEHPVPLGRLKPELPAALASLVMSMLEKERSARPSAVEVDDALDKILGSPAMVGAGHTGGAAKDGRPRGRTPHARGRISGHGLRPWPDCDDHRRAGDRQDQPRGGSARRDRGGSASAGHRAGPLFRAVEWRGSYLPILEVLDSLLHGQTIGRFTR
jgi:hypothetical protein